MHPEGLSESTHQPRIVSCCWIAPFVQVSWQRRDILVRIIAFDDELSGIEPHGETLQLTSAQPSHDRGKKTPQLPKGRCCIRSEACGSDGG